MLEDYVVVASVAVMVGSLVIMASVLSRYRTLVEDADKSARLAKDVWDSVNSRFSVTDGRIIDLMAKTEMLSSRGAPAQASVQGVGAPTSPSRSEFVGPANVPKIVSVVPVPAGEGNETEVRVLLFLAQGPRNSAQIREEIGRSREHTARLMKTLFDRGLVIRNDQHKPYVYEITDSGRAYVSS